MSQKDVSSNCHNVELVLKKAVKNNHNFDYASGTIDTWIRKYELSSDCVNELIEILKEKNHSS